MSDNVSMFTTKHSKTRLVSYFTECNYKLGKLDKRDY